MFVASRRPHHNHHSAVEISRSDEPRLPIVTPVIDGRCALLGREQLCRLRKIETPVFQGPITFARVVADRRN
jgi:hypothetical protein